MAKKQAAAVQEGAVVTTGELLHLVPEVILADDNTRFGLKASRIESLAKSILERGEVLEPVEVELLPEASNGHQYRLTTGFYRLAAVTHLNTSGAGLTVPAIVRPIPTPQERLRRQLAENMERENQSPMDTAIAIKRLMDIGLTRMEIREMYSRPGGRKGNKTQPASNSFLNMHLSFLDFPKNIQNKIHEGVLGTAGAYELTRQPKEKWSAILDKAEQDRQSAVEKEERAEEKLLADEKRKNEAQEKRDKMQAEVMAASEKAKQAQQALADVTAKATEAYTASIGKHASATAKKEAKRAFLDADKQKTIAEADALSAQKDYEALQQKFTKHEQSIAEKAEKLRQARAAAPAGAAKKGDTVGPTDVKKAAAATGATTNYVPLNKNEIIKTVNELCLPGGSPKVIAIGQALARCFAGEFSPDMLHKELVKIVG